MPSVSGIHPIVIPGASAAVPSMLWTAAMLLEAAL